MLIFLSFLLVQRRMPFEMIQSLNYSNDDKNTMNEKTIAQWMNSALFINNRRLNVILARETPSMDSPSSSSSRRMGLEWPWLLEERYASTCLRRRSTLWSCQSSEVPRWRSQCACPSEISTGTTSRMVSHATRRSTTCSTTSKRRWSIVLR